MGDNGIMGNDDTGSVLQVLQHSANDENDQHENNMIISFAMEVHKNYYDLENMIKIMIRDLISRRAIFLMRGSSSLSTNFLMATRWPDIVII